MPLRAALDAYLSSATVRDTILGTICRRLHCPRAEAEDVFSEAVCVAYRSIDGLRSIDSLPYWFAIIVRRMGYLNIHRRAHDRAMTAELFERTCYPSSIHSPERDLLDRERYEIMAALLECISQQARDILERFYLNGESLSEIAVALGVEYRNAKLRKHRAKRRLVLAWNRQQGD